MSPRRVMPPPAVAGVPASCRAARSRPLPCVPWTACSTTPWPSLMEEGDLRLAESANRRQPEAPGGRRGERSDERASSCCWPAGISPATRWHSRRTTRSVRSLFYTRALAYGTRGLVAPRHPAERLHLRCRGHAPALAKLGRSDVPLVFWTASAWGSAVNLQLADPDAIASLPTHQRPDGMGEGTRA